MFLRGLHTRGRSLQSWPILVTLSGIVFLIYIFRKKQILVTDAPVILNLLLSSGLNETLSRFAVAQAAHETDGFTSAIYKSNKNAFGMKFAGQVNAMGVKNGYANYSAIQYSVADFVAWYTRHRISIFSLPLFITNLASYVRFLKNNQYFEADEAAYLKGVTYFYNQIFT